jgi:hypothetical protein
MQSLYGPAVISMWGAGARPVAHSWSGQTKNGLAWGEPGREFLGPLLICLTNVVFLNRIGGAFPSVRRKPAILRSPEGIHNRGLTALNNP